MGGICACDLCVRVRVRVRVCVCVTSARVQVCGLDGGRGRSPWGRAAGARAWPGASQGGGGAAGHPPDRRPRHERR